MDYHERNNWYQNAKNKSKRLRKPVVDKKFKTE